MMNTISTIQNFPNRTPLETVQGRITSVFEYEPQETKYGPTTKQNLYLEDSTGKIKVESWGQPDLSGLKGREVVIQANGTGKGVSVSHNTWKGKTEVRLSLSKAANVQPVGEPANAGSVQNKAVPAHVGTKTTTSASNGSYVEGAAVGMAINKAVDIMIEGGFAPDGSVDFDELHRIASGIYKVSERMKAGDFGDAPVAAPVTAPEPAKTAPKPIPEPPMAYNPADDDGEDVPF
jgi:hypothetical protein